MMPRGVVTQHPPLQHPVLCKDMMAQSGKHSLRRMYRLHVSQMLTSQTSAHHCASADLLMRPAGW